MSKNLLTVAYHGKSPLIPQENQGQKRDFMLRRAAKKFFMPKFLGHTNITLSSPNGECVTAGFLPQQKPDGSFVPASHDNHLTPLYSGTSDKFLWLAKHVPTSEGLVYTKTNSKNNHPDAYLSFEVSADEHCRVVNYIAHTGKQLLAFNPVISNCVLFTVNSCLQAGFDFRKLAEAEHNTRVPDGVLASFAIMATAMGPRGTGVHVGQMDGRSVEVGFNCPKLVAKIQEAMGIIIPSPPQDLPVTEPAELHP